MQVEFLIQNGKENSLISSLNESFSKRPKKVYMFLGDIKEAGFRLVEEEFIDTDIKLFIAVGVNKKHTTRSMLDSILDYTKDAYYYTNNDIVEFDSNICIFEYTNQAVIYVASSSFSESGISENISIYNKITVDLKDQTQKADYKKIIKDLTKSLEGLEFVKLTKTKINELVEKKEIFSTRQYTHTNVMSISELLGKKDKEETKPAQMSKNEIDDVYVSDIEIPKVDLSDIDIEIDEIDLSNELGKEEIKEESSNKDIEVEYDKDAESVANMDSIQDFEEEIDDLKEDIIDKDNELYDESLADMDFYQDGVLDINDMLFSKADVKLDVDIKNKKQEETEEESEMNEFEKEELLQVKKVNLNNVSNVIMELPNKPSKAQDLANLKVPNHLQKMIPEFFELQDKGKNVEINGTSYKQREINLEIIDVKSGEKYTDREAKMMQKKGQSYLTITSDVIKNIDYSEYDVARIIKLSSDTYHIEIISKDMQEYKLWNKLCTQNFKSSIRKFGVM